MRILLVAFILLTLTVTAQKKDTFYKVLVVTAHPDDETAMAATIYKITHELHGMVDQFMITNGEGGYKYSTLAESIYGAELTEEKIGRERLPLIRKQELINAGKIIGMHNIFFLDQKDAHYTLDEHEPLDTSWNIPWVTTRLKEVLSQNHYDFVFCLLPDSSTHGGHKAATLLALRIVQSLPESVRPAIFGVGVSNKTDSIRTYFSQLNNYAETKTASQLPLFTTDRTASFGYNNQLSYKIIVNWEIAEHKSQGTMQLAMNRGDYEIFWSFAMNTKESVNKARHMFESLKNVPYKTKKY